MALPSAAVWEFRPGTGSNSNGGFFKSGGAGTDYSQQASAQLSITDLQIHASDNTKVKSAATPFLAAHQDNGLQITAGTGFTPGFYHVTSAPDGSGYVTLDRACGTVGSTGGTAALGGALAVFTDAILESAVAGNVLYVKSDGTMALTGDCTIDADGTTANPIQIIGYQTARGDGPTGSGRPTIACGANALTLGDYWWSSYLIVTTTGSYGFELGASGRKTWCKSTNSSGTANRHAHRDYSGRLSFCEGISTNGYAFGTSGSAVFYLYCYAHDSDTGFRGANSWCVFYGCIADTCVSNGVSLNPASLVLRCTVYNCGSGINAGTAYNCTLDSNLIDTCATGVRFTSAQPTAGRRNNYHANTADTLNYTKEADATAVDPAFNDAAGGDFVTGSAVADTGCALRAGLGLSVDAKGDQGAYAPANTLVTDLATLLARLTATRAENLDDLDVAVSSRSSHSAADAGSAAAGAILVTPANKLGTDAAGKVVGSSVDALGAQARADVNAEADAALADYDPPTKAELDAGLAGIDPPSPDEIAAAVAALDLTSGTDYEALAKTSARLGAMIAACRMVLAGKMDAPSGLVKRYYEVDGTTPGLQVTHAADYTNRGAPS
jgi:hypothetical protein